MIIKYRILDVSENDRSMVVRYFTDSLSEEYLTSQRDSDGNPIVDANNKPVRCITDYNITLFNIGENPSQQDIINRIKSAAPVQLLNLKEEVVSNTNVNLENLYILANTSNLQFDSSEVTPTPPTIFIP